MTTLSIIIVSYNTKELIPSLIDSITGAVSSLKLQTEIIIVDNASADGTSTLIKQDYPQVILIPNKTNSGYAKANNQGIQKAKGDYLLLLNTDVILTPSVLSTMISYLEKYPDIGVVTCKVVLPNGKIDPACHRGFPTPWASLTYFLGLERLFPKLSLFSQYHLWYKNLNQVHEIDSPSGAFYFTKKEVVKKVGLLDEAYFMYGEDLDWSYRIKKAGWKIIYNPQAQVVHLKKRSGLQSQNTLIKKKTIEAFYTAMKIFYQKYYEKKYPKFISFCIYQLIDFKKLIDSSKV